MWKFLYWTNKHVWKFSNVDDILKQCDSMCCENSDCNVAILTKFQQCFLFSCIDMREGKFVCTFSQNPNFKTYVKVTQVSSKPQDQYIISLLNPDPEIKVLILLWLVGFPWYIKCQSKSSKNIYIWHSFNIFPQSGEITPEVILHFQILQYYAEHNLESVKSNSTVEQDKNSVVEAKEEDGECPRLSWTCDNKGNVKTSWYLTLV